jgi:two-component system, LytTR family, sensor kinase
MAQAFVSAGFSLAASAFQRLPLDVWTSLRSWVLGGLIWAAFTPVAIWLARRFPVQRQILIPLAIHFAIGLSTVLVFPAVYTFLHQLLPKRAYFAMLVFNGDHVLRHYWVVVAMVLLFDKFSESRRRALQESRLETQLAHAELNALQMHLHPHFLFNALNSVAVLMRRDVDAADRALSRLSNLLRVTLRSSGESQIPIEQEVDFLRSYLDMELLRFQDRLTAGISVEPSASGALVPRFILQPLVENAVKHGVANRERDARIDIRAVREGEALRLEVEDNGPEFHNNTAPAHTSAPTGKVGMANIRGRLSLLYGDKGYLNAGTLPSGGFRATVVLPFQTS